MEGYTVDTGQGQTLAIIKRDPGTCGLVSQDTGVTFQNERNQTLYQSRIMSERVCFCFLMIAPLIENLFRV